MFTTQNNSTSYGVKWDFSYYLGISVEVLILRIKTYKCQKEVQDTPLQDLLKVEILAPWLLLITL